MSNAKTKLIQNLTQSYEIKFGNFLEKILSDYILEVGYEPLDKQIGTDQENNPLSANQVFQASACIYLIEQAVRDDHDCQKRKEQCANFCKKIQVLEQRFPHKTLKACMWFSDDALKKNQKYYQEQIARYSNEQTFIFYGRELFSYLFCREDIYEEFIAHLKRRKKERGQDILSIPDFDTSNKAREALLKLQTNKPKLIQKLLSNQEPFIELREELFPTGENLKVLSC
ncbi:HpyAIV family type II restriction enzyme [Helicobacter cynogastricus]|uniref:HpyAIV family type II restriction enzyme n=1 Tax=Helicobacter cynogastricus TaxID=329937 RepID=UPI001F2CE7A1|nr:restriction endonuclease [Helicobacter cynogastricus]